MTTKVDPETLALRAPPRPVTRLSRRMLIAATVAIAVLVMAVTLWSLQKNLRLPDVRPELHNVDRIMRTESLDRLPPDYSKLEPPKDAGPSIPVLGKPLPGDLGAAMFKAEQAAAPSTAAASDAQRAGRLPQERETEDAAKAPLFFRLSSQRETKSASTEPAARPTDDRHGISDAAGNSRTGPQKLEKNAMSGEHRVQDPASPYQVMAGTIIPAALITGINSDLPGIVLATVTEPVYDSKLGRYLLIPQGTRLIGEYASQVAYGQRRVLLAWNRLVFPDATSLTLDRLPGVDSAGHAGLEDGIDRHWNQILAGAALSTLIGVAAELASPNRSSGQQVIVAAQQSVQDSINQVGQELTKKNLNVQPTLAIRPGFPVRVFVSKDLVLRPYQPPFVNRSPQ